MSELLKYFDNSATSFPKPVEVGQYIQNHLNSGGTYGRGGYPRVFQSTGMVETLREKLSDLFGIEYSENIAFTSNSTQAINTILLGIDVAGKEILISPLEHNAVTRPLEILKREQSVKLTILPHFSDGLIDVPRIPKMLSTKVALVIVNHQSNVNGLIQPLADIKRAIGEVPLMVDASQSAGHIPIDCDRIGIDYLAFTGHKGLLGPTGIGGFFVRNPETIAPLIYGGTGSNSDSFEMPTVLPDKFQAGTPNLVGAAGLLGAISSETKSMHTASDFFEMLNHITNVKGIQLFSANEPSWQGETFSFRFIGEDPGNSAFRLYQEFGIEVRSGLHCAPLAHTTLGSFPHGLVRISLSPFHTKNDLDFLASAVNRASSTRKT